ncbi:MAG: hypothetical protein MRY64_04210 [Hyphomonadaceae bacterium]|nr:hypothetical protein [Hyphomonadaceae bacterium]
MQLSQRRIGVIDIGSNSVRLVIFSISGRAVFPVFNEKVMAGLGQGLGETGRLSPSGRLLALAALARFRAILQALDVTEVRAVATAAVRVAEDGAEFAKEAAEAASVDLAILSGIDEGRVSAEGVATGFFDPDGVIGDLGGSSLELFGLGEMAHRQPGETHMLGPLALADLSEAPEKRIRAHVREVLSASGHVQTGISTLYAVGGAWRGFAKVTMDATNYPLRVLHGYAMSPGQVKRTTALIQDKRGTSDLSSIAGRRHAQLHLTSIVLDELVRVSKAERVLVSSYGLREGVIAGVIGEGGGDPLIDGAVAFASLTRSQKAFGEALMAFTRPVFEGREAMMGDWARESRLHHAACLLADVAGKYHPDHRHEMAFEQALYSPMSTFDHSDRAFLAASLAWRYKRSFSYPKSMSSLLSNKQQNRARQLGQVMRLGAVFSGRSADILDFAQLEVLGGRLVFRLDRDNAPLLSEIVERRLNHASDALGLKPMVSLT